MSSRSLLLLALFAATSNAILPNGRIPDGIILSGPLTKRSGSTGCNADNALRNLRDSRYSSSASLFCSVWLQSTLIDTLQITATASATATETPEPVTVTIETTDTITNTETTYTTVHPTAVNTFLKRGEIAYPSWLPATYPATRVSSACSCFIASPSPPVITTFTTTVATLTNTATVTLEPLTNTETSFITATTSATKLVTETGPGVSCGITGCSNGAGFFTWEWASDVQGCRALCLSYGHCKSYQYGSNGCGLFEVEIAATFAPGSGSDATCSLFQFYDFRCLV
ncbi:hypothetical protein TWF106_007580 [Orbilia oligospora]|uniref:Apple domain-containing protein n=1 Tax=Orbilia oligospora TaxID=2813651 RepID=A0A7C8QLR2_ORBOL|nr:hypothetical protein TWF106_007580 [Orbilia oligospora]